MRVKRQMPIDIQSELLAIAAITIVGWVYVGHLANYAGCSNPVIIILFGHSNRNYIILRIFCDKVVAATSIKEGPYAFGINWSPQ